MTARERAYLVADEQCREHEQVWARDCDITPDHTKRVVEELWWKYVARDRARMELN